MSNSSLLGNLLYISLYAHKTEYMKEEEEEGKEDGES